MAATPDQLEVLPAPKGTEPEEAPARRVQWTSLDVNLAPQLPDVVSRSGRPALEFPGATHVARSMSPVTSEMQAGEAATLLRARCARCVNFRGDVWTETMRVWRAVPFTNARRRGLADMIKHLAGACVDGTPSTYDLKRAAIDLASWGVCEALTEERKDLIVVHPDACCPDGVAYYQDRDRDSRKEASAVFDRIMRMAQGRT